MRKSTFVLIFISITLQSNIFSQSVTHEYFVENLEVYFNFKADDKDLILELSEKISIDNIRNGIVYAYANELEFRDFQKYNIEYFILPHPGDVGNLKMSDKIEGLEDWDSYPTYQAYLDLMTLFSVNNPDICQLVEIGTSVQGRKLLFVKISDNVAVRENEPQFMYTSSIHGDETTGYALMLRLIDSLLTGYGNDSRITHLIDNLEIWINPLANPDGTYWGGNNTVNGARRYNANGYDLNRNFPDPDNGPNPNGPWQPETIAMMNLAEQNKFVLSANFHGGTEVINYPWDTWSQLHADDGWFQYISRQYADTAHFYSPISYMSGYNNGITNGYQWYSIAGGRQDYMTYFHGCRETTIEISNTKLLNPSLLPVYWIYNRSSFLNYMEQSLFGISGITSDEDGNPISVKVQILGHDFNNSEIYSDPDNGGYFRMLIAGVYDIRFSAEGYFDFIKENIVVNNNERTELNVQLTQQIVPVTLINFSATIRDNYVIINWETGTEDNNEGFFIERNALVDKTWKEIIFITGHGSTTSNKAYKFLDTLSESGIYSYRLKQIDFNGTITLSHEVAVEFSPPVDFQLYQNYPNPFNNNTKIKFAIPESMGKETDVELEIHNLLGEKVKNMIFPTLNGGIYEINFNSNSLPSGHYFYTLKRGNIIETKKMTLLK